MKNKSISAGSILWLHFYNKAKPGHAHCGDYGYIEAYAPNRSEKIEDGELYVKVALKEIIYNHGNIRFCLEIVNKDNTCSYSITVDEPERLSYIDWKNPVDIKWSIPPNIFHWLKQKYNESKI